MRVFFFFFFHAASDYFPLQNCPPLLFQHRPFGVCRGIDVLVFRLFSCRWRKKKNADPHKFYCLRAVRERLKAPIIRYCSHLYILNAPIMSYLLPGARDLMGAFSFPIPLFPHQRAPLLLLFKIKELINQFICPRARQIYTPVHRRRHETFYFPNNGSGIEGYFPYKRG